MTTETLTRIEHNRSLYAQMDKLGERLDRTNSPNIYIELLNEYNALHAQLINVKPA